MSREEVRSELSEDGINLDVHKKRLREMMQQVHGQERLAQAAAKRARLETQATSESTDQYLANVKTETRASLLDEVRQRIGVLGLQQPQLVGLYNRKLENATDDDLRAILEDLAFLDSPDEVANNEEQS